jgi:hypothetical protein
MGTTAWNLLKNSSPPPFVESCPNCVEASKVRGSPPEQQEGWMRDEEKVAKPPQLAQTGGVARIV